MKRIAIAAACLAAATAAAQVEVPAQSCEPKPKYPGLRALKSDVEVKAFEAEIRAYKECIGRYISERKAAMKAHESAMSAAADEHNTLMARIRTDQEAAREAAEKGAGAPAPDSGGGRKY